MIDRIINIQVLGLISFLFFSSCVEKETPKPVAHISGEVTRDEIFIGTDYKKQIFYNLETGVETAENLKTIWDFAVSNTGNHIKLNSSKMMTASKTVFTELKDLTSVESYDLLADHPSEYIDTMSIGNWAENKVYLIDRGYNSVGEHLGYAKIKTYKDGSKRMLNYALLDGEGEQTIELIKDDLYSYSYISIDNGQVNIAPEDEQWHVCFTQYTHLFDPEMPYLVTGVLTNPANTRARAYSDSAFAHIDLETAKRVELTDSSDAIGYDWKTYSFNTGDFVVHTDKNYVLKIRNDYYKLHFIDFYTSEGLKGNFHIEYQKL